MKKLAVIMIAAATLVAGSVTTSYASDWDKAGKVLAVFEGLRVLTGGKADVIGTVTGINRPGDRDDRGRQGWGYGDDRDDRGNHYGWRNRERCEYERVWVPHYVWKEKFVPEHIEYRNGRKTVIEAHCERYQVEQGGHWETVRHYSCR